ncbi:DUF5777 family beta-barrel protein [Sinomicrobium weinanense]|uniref:DUF5777 domain-containing protein n=1 Tax=Sinomicrobium weinanense TaxID=2842200 RepID=A0A926JSV5_9FLAO|nr:DUF5777 family beta-barrel protein [Sinomicrobium weinanense]MBC9796694.1 hypothetical protein [Sinomicrobium weinanense]MBU3123031.1 hypothetical protein [Sinomicrobium weinanense]
MKLLTLLLFVLPLCCFSQDDLLDELDAEVEENGYVKAAFKGIKIVNFESTKLLYKNDFYFVVSHRFGSIKYGLDDFFGLDQAVTRLQFMYGISDGITVGISRSSYQKNYGATIKYRLLRQKENGFPFTVVGYHLVAVNTEMSKDNLPEMEFKHRLSYTTQLLISRKFTDKLSLELMPTFLHENYVVVNEQDNSQFALGVGGRYKLSPRWSINADYGWHLNRAGSSPFKNPLSIGIDLETGGHIFQMHFTNAQPMFENGFLGQAAGDWGDGDIYFGFNLTRIF